MSGPIAVRLGDELEDRFDSYHESRSGDHKESDTFRYLLNKGLRAEELPLYNRLGVEDREGEPNPVGAQLEAAREPTESQEDVVRRFLGEAVETREADTLDKIGADGELRERVEAAQEEGETLDDAVRRLLRLGVRAASEDGPTSLVNRLVTAVVVFFIVAVPVGLALNGEDAYAGGFVLMYVLLVVFGPQLDRAWRALRRAATGVRQRFAG